MQKCRLKLQIHLHHNSWFSIMNMLHVAYYKFGELCVQTYRAILAYEVVTQLIYKKTKFTSPIIAIWNLNHGSNGIVRRRETLWEREEGPHLCLNELDEWVSEQAMGTAASEGGSKSAPMVARWL